MPCSFAEVIGGREPVPAAADDHGVAPWHLARDPAMPAPSPECPDRACRIKEKYRVVHRVFKPVLSLADRSLRPVPSGHFVVTRHIIYK